MIMMIRRHRKKIGSRRNGGFTLVELLVVIAIIALLVSMLMPSLSKARAAARNTQCQSQLRRLGMCWLYYAQDNKGYAPGSGWYAVGPAERQVSWYINPKQTAYSPWTMTCPDMDLVVAGASPYWGGTYAYNTYWYNSGNVFNPTTDRLLKVAHVRGGSRKAVFYDGVGFAMNAGFYTYPAFGDYLTIGRHGNRADGVLNDILERHVNTVFGDAHVEMILWTLKSAQQDWTEILKVN